MAILAKTLMDIYYSEVKRWHQQMDEADDPTDVIEISQAYSDAESMVNNLMHGRPDSEWVPQFVKIMRERAAESRPLIAAHFELIAATAEESIS